MRELYNTCESCASTLYLLDQEKCLYYCVTCDSEFTVENVDNKSEGLRDSVPSVAEGIPLVTQVEHHEAEAPPTKEQMVLDEVEDTPLPERKPVKKITPTKLTPVKVLGRDGTEKSSSPREKNARLKKEFKGIEPIKRPQPVLVTPLKHNQLEPKRKRKRSFLGFSLVTALCLVGLSLFIKKKSPTDPYPTPPQQESITAQNSLEKGATSHQPATPLKNEPVTATLPTEEITTQALAGGLQGDTSVRIQPPQEEITADMNDHIPAEVISPVSIPDTSIVIPQQGENVKKELILQPHEKNPHRSSDPLLPKSSPSINKVLKEQEVLISQANNTPLSISSQPALSVQEKPSIPSVAHSKKRKKTPLVESQDQVVPEHIGVLSEDFLY